MMDAPHEQEHSRRGAPARDPRDRAAWALTRLLSPLLVAPALLGAVAAGTTTGPGPFLGWWLLSAAFVGLVPAAVLAHARSRGRVSDRWVTRPGERVLIFTASLLSFGVGASLLVTLGAPREVLAVTLGAIVGIGVLFGLLRTSKVSVHVGAVSGSVVILGLVYGPWALVLALLVPLAGWARVRIAHHTLRQVVAGGLIGAVAAGVVFVLTPGAF